jgi:predicted RNA binding protein YcfA (HicA-like mRNA interferase family)
LLEPKRLGYSVIAMKVRDMLKLLATEGWVVKTQRGSHRQLVHPTKPGKVTVPGHPSDEIKSGTLQGIPPTGGTEGVTTMASKIDTLRARVEALEGLCAEVYQLAGTVGAPARFLDALAAAAAGKRLPKATLLPVLETECEAIREREDLLAQARQLFGVSAAAELGRKGGSKTSRAKKRAAKENGRKGGRPRRVLSIPFRLGAVPAGPGEDPKSMKIEY